MLHYINIVENMIDKNYGIFTTKTLKGIYAHDQQENHTNERERGKEARARKKWLAIVSQGETHSRTLPKSGMVLKNPARGVLHCAIFRSTCPRCKTKCTEALCCERLKVSCSVIYKL